MARRTILRDTSGEIIDTRSLTEEDGAPTIMGVRQIRSEHPSYGLSPEGLASILRNSETQDPSRFFSLCADIEEREEHYRSVLGTRKGAVSQLPITVTPAGDDTASEEQAKFVRECLEKPGFALELIDMLDALGKGISWTEIVWDTSELQYMPLKLAWRDPRWFRLDISDLTTGLLLDNNGQPQPLKPYKWIVHQPKLLSGIPIRNGLTRAAAYGWMFKNFALKDWLVFLEVYGHPLRLGRYPQNASAAEKRTLLRAVAELGSDAAAIIPEAMKVEFVDGGASTAGGSPFKEMAEYFDMQASKLVLGQTGTTDAVAGGSRGLGAVQDGVREDIERMDGIQISATVNRDLVRPMVDLNFGPQKKYPVARIGRPESKDVKLILGNLPELVGMGFKVSQVQVRGLMGLEEPEAGAELLHPSVSGSPPGANRADAAPGGVDPNASTTADSVAASQQPEPPSDAIDEATLEMIASGGWVPETDDLQKAIAGAASFDEARKIIAAHIDKLGLDKLADLIARARMNARLAAAAGETLS
jgi:phage gp29-like protein